MSGAPVAVERDRAAARLLGRMPRLIASAQDLEEGLRRSAELVAEAVAGISAKTGRSEAAARAELERYNPQGRLVSPEEVAAAVLWLCLPESRSITGQAIAVAGGEVT